MRILHLIQRYLPAIGGAEHHMHELSARLVAAGHEVTVATTDALDFELFWDPRRRRLPLGREEIDGVQVLRFPLRHLPLPRLGYPAWRRMLWFLSGYTPAPVSLLHRLAQFTPYVPELWQWLDQTEEPFDLVAGMTICFEPIAQAGLALAQRRGIPFVCYPLTHLGAGTAPGQDSLARFYTMRHQVDTVLRSQGVIAQSETERDFYVDRGLAGDRCLVGGPGVTPAEVTGGDGESFRQAHGILPEHRIVAFIGSMSGDKGTIDTVEAVRLLWQQGLPVELALAGTALTPFVRYLEGLPDADRSRIRLLGPISHQTKRDLLAAMDLLVMPSRTDSFGIVYLEAWLNRKPVIGADVWGINRIIAQGQDGLLVPFGRPTALAQAMTDLLTDPEKRRRMGEAGRAKALGQHTWSHKFQITENLYAALIRPAPGASHKQGPG